MSIRLSSIEVTRVQNTIFIPLPPELWRPTGDGFCICPTCKADYAKSGDRLVMNYWDTLAVPVPGPRSADNRTWMVHYPELHSEVVRLAKQRDDAAAALVK
jgi:hypothetical protein